MSIATKKSDTTEELYFHIREPHVGKNGRRYKAGTVFCRPIGDVWFMSAARCSEEDNFCRSVGRATARRRWFNDIPDGSFKVKPNYEAALTLYKEI